jgi:hypothetical protein
MGTLTPSRAMVKVCETPVSGFSEVACVAGASALGLLGSRGSLGWRIEPDQSVRP